MHNRFKGLGFLLAFILINSAVFGQTNSDLSLKINQLIKDGKYMQAYKMAEETAEIVYIKSGEKSYDYCVALNDWAYASEKMGVPEKSVDLYLQSLRILAYSLDITHPLFFTTSDKLAQIYKKLNLYEKVAGVYDMELSVAEGIWEETDTLYINAVLNLGAAYDVLGKYKLADSLVSIANTLTLKIYGESSLKYAHSLLIQAVLYDNMGQYLKSEACYNQVVIIQKKKLGEKSAAYAQTLNNLAFLYCHMGKYKLSETTYLQAIDIRKKSLGESHYLYASSLNNLGGLYQIIGNYAKAEQLFMQAAEIRKAVLGEEDELYAGSLNNLATLYYLMGNYEKALPIYIQTLQIYKVASGENSYEYANVLNNIANTYKQMGASFSETEKILKEALEIQKGIYGDSSLQYASYLSNLAMLYAQKHYNFKAMPLLLQCLDIQNKIIGKNHPDYATTLDNLGSVQFNMMNYQKSKDYYANAMEIRKVALGQSHPAFANSLNNLGSISYFMGNYPDAATYFEQSKTVVLQNIDKNFSFLTESEKEKYINTIGSEFKKIQNFYFDYYSSQPSIAATAYDIELATKGMILNAGVNMRQAILNSENTEALKLYDEWITAKSVIARQTSLPVDSRSTNLAEEEEKANNLEKQLTILSASFKDADNLLGNTWQTIQKKLGTNEVAIEFTHFTCNDKKKWIDSIMYVALVIKPGDQSPTLIPLCEASQLDSLLRKEGNTESEFISNLYRGSGLVNTKTLSISKRLYELVWKPLDKILAKGNKIYFAPTGLLHQIAFAALPYSDKALLSDQYQLIQVSTTAMILKESKFKEIIPTSIAIYGGINYDELEKSETKTKEPIDVYSQAMPEDLEKIGLWNYLPGTLAEAKAIEAIANTKKIKVSMLTGSSALEEKFKLSGGKNAPRVIHISSHGFFFPDPELDEKKREYISQSIPKTIKSSDNPLNRAGLLFSGANMAWQGNANKNADDGILTAYEAANVSLLNTQLVVLSACETGLGDIKGSEGVFGLQRAFKMAGAEYLIMSLWKVPDTETAEFMTQFYSLWFEGKTIQDAFIQTQTLMKTKYPKDPYKWAAFVLVR